jgi:hypothetical protein
MKLTPEQRQYAFFKARSIDDSLGDLFQNDMILSADDIVAEMDRLHDIQQRLMTRMKFYKKDLTDILAAMGQGKDTLS